MNLSDQKHLKMAIDLARKGMNAAAGGPFGAIVVKDGIVVGKGYNMVTSTNDPTAHAEVVAIRDACKNLNTFQLKGCAIYCSCEPCPMCLGAIYWARPERVIFACTKRDAAKAGFDDDFIYKEIQLDPTERSIPSSCGLQEEGKEVFAEWLNLIDRTDY